MYTKLMEKSVFVEHSGMLCRGAFQSFTDVERSNNKILFYTPTVSNTNLA